MMWVVAVDPEGLNQRPSRQSSGNANFAGLGAACHTGITSFRKKLQCAFNIVAQSHQQAECVGTLCPYPLGNMFSDGLTVGQQVVENGKHGRDNQPRLRQKQPIHCFKILFQNSAY